MFLLIAYRSRHPSLPQICVEDNIGRMNAIYLDYNATTPIDPQVAEAMLPYIHEHFGNPSSSHDFGLAAKEAVDAARDQVAEMLGCLTSEVVFTSGGTEANNYAIKGVAGAYKSKGNHIITAISALNGHEHDGRALTVNEAKPRASRGPGGPGGRY